MSQPNAVKNTQRSSTWRAGRNIQSTNKSEYFQEIIYYLPVCNLLRIQQYLVNTTYNRCYQKFSACLGKGEKADKSDTKTVHKKFSLVIVDNKIPVHY